MDLTEMIKKLRVKSNMDSQKSVAKYICPICKDSGWKKTSNGYVRCDCFKKRTAADLWKSFGINPADVKKIAEYMPIDENTMHAKEKAINYVRGFSDIKIQRENSFGLFGQPGSGKSHLVIGIGAALLNQKKPIQVIYMPYLEVMRKLKANTNDDEYYLKLSSKFNKAELLIIDDLFKDKLKNGKLIRDRYGYIQGLNEADMKHIYPILNYRYFNKLPMLISSECTPETLLELDRALAGRILESCGNNISVFKGDKYDYRMRRFKKD